MTEISADDELASLSEFTFLRENAKQAGATGPLPIVERIDSGAISALKFGDAAPRVVFLHGGGQNAHTWDTVIVGLGEPALALDLPGHGRSAWREDGDYGPKLNATAVEPVVRELAPDADLVVGMSLGGLTALRLAVTAPELVRRLVLVDVTPSAPERHTEMTDEQKGTVALVQGERTFPSFDAMLEVTVAAAPHRDRESLRRGVFHNAKRLDDGTWTWRYDSIPQGRGLRRPVGGRPEPHHADDAGARRRLVLRQRRRRRRIRPHRTRIPGRAHRRELRALGAERSAAPARRYLARNPRRLGSAAARCSSRKCRS